MRRRTKDPRDRQGYNLGARYLVFLVITLGMFAYLLTGVFRLQVVESEGYVNDAESSRTTTITLRGSRGMITDADAVILARDADIYNVTFYRDASQNSAAQYRELTQSIVETVEIIERNGNELDVDFVIERDPETNEWIFNFGSGVIYEALDTCEGARYSCYISADMKLMPCSFDQSEKYAVSLQDHTIADAWNSEEFEAFRKPLRNRCPDCMERANCMGGCPLMPGIVLCKKETKMF